MIATRFRDLPIASNSIDLLLLPHVLEFSVNPHQILREVQRVLMPDGHAVPAQAFHQQEAVITHFLELAG